MEPHVWVVSLWSRAHEWGPIRLHARGLDPIGTHRHEWVPFRALCTGQAPYGPIQTIGPIGTHAHSRALRQPSPTGGVPPAAPGHNRQGAPSPHALWCPPPEAAPGVPPLRDPHPLAWGNPVGSGGGGGPTPPPMGHPHGGTPHSPPLPHPRNPHGGKAGGWGWGTVRKWGGGHWGGAAGPPALTRVTQELHSQAGSSGDPSRVTGTPGGSQGRRWGRGSPRRGGPRRSHRGAAEDTMGTRER